MSSQEAMAAMWMLGPGGQTKEMMMGRGLSTKEEEDIIIPLPSRRL